MLTLRKVPSRNLGRSDPFYVTSKAYYEGQCYLRRRRLAAVPVRRPRAEGKRAHAPTPPRLRRAGVRPYDTGQQCHTDSPRERGSGRTPLLRQGSEGQACAPTTSVLGASGIGSQGLGALAYSRATNCLVMSRTICSSSSPALKIARSSGLINPSASVFPLSQSTIPCQ